jgi:hypothetical protein
MPGFRDSHIDAALTNVAVEYVAPGTIADIIFPSVPVAKVSNKYFIVDAAREDLKQSDDRRGQEGYPNKMDWALSTDSYSAEEHILEDLVTTAQEENTDTPIRPRVTSTQLLVKKLAMNKEIAAASLCASGITQSKAASGTTTKWKDADGKPIDDIQSQIDVIESAIGMSPNIGWCDSAVYRALRTNAQVTAAFKSGVVTESEIRRVIADILGLEQLVVCKLKKNTSRNRTASLSAVWGKDFYLGYIDPNPGDKVMTVGLTFDWIGNGSMQGWKVAEFEDGRAGGTFVQAGRWYDQKITVAAAAAKVTGCIV